MSDLWRMTIKNGFHHWELKFENGAHAVVSTGKHREWEGKATFGLHTRSITGNFRTPSEIRIELLCWLAFRGALSDYDQIGIFHEGGIQ